MTGINSIVTVYYTKISSAEGVQPLFILRRLGNDLVQFVDWSPRILVIGLNDVSGPII